MSNRWTSIFFAAAVVAGNVASAQSTLLNVSYDPTRKFYLDFNKAFSVYWQARTATAVHIRQSHGGSGKQARAVIDGLSADVVTLSTAYDIDAIAAKGRLLPANWQKRLPHNSAPYTSTIVFLVRKGNPKGIKDWDDLARPGIAVITPNPKTSGGAQWNYLAAWHFAKLKYGGDSQAMEFVRRLYKNVPVLDSGSRGSANTFVRRGLGDVYISWESEAFLALTELGQDTFLIVMPSVSILAEPSVALVDRNVDRKGSREVAEAYLQYLYTEEGQEIAARNFYRPINPKVAKKYEKQFPRIALSTIAAEFGGWQNAAKTHFADGGTFDQIFQPGK